MFEQPNEEVPQLFDSEAQKLIGHLKEGQLSADVLSELEQALSEVEPYRSPEVIAAEKQAAEEKAAKRAQKEIDSNRYVFSYLLNQTSHSYHACQMALGRRGWLAIAEEDTDIMSKITALRKLFIIDDHHYEVFDSMRYYPGGRGGDESTGQSFNLISGQGEDAVCVYFDYHGAATDIYFGIKNIVAKMENGEITEGEKVEIDRLLKLGAQILKFQGQDAQSVGGLTGVSITGDLRKYVVQKYD